MKREPAVIIEEKRLASPAPAPQALAWHGDALWVSSRDSRRVYGINVQTWTVFEEKETPGIPWAATSTGDALAVTMGEDPEDDRYLRRYIPGDGFSPEDRIACPEFTGSYLSYDGNHLYLSQWYNHRILELDATGNILRTIDIGAEICGQTYVDGLIYVLRGTEKNGESWSVARLDPREETPAVEDLARLPFPGRSLASDGKRFWSNHRAADAIISFALPESAQ